MHVILRLVRGLLDILYPPRCPVCHDIVPYGTGLLCTGCVGRVQILKEPLCKKCGRPVAAAEEEFCFDCSVKRHNYEQGAAACLYSDTIRQSVYMYKYGHRQEYAEYYAQMMISRGQQCITRWQPQVIIPVPLHKARQRSRGFNPAELLAVKIGEQTGIPVDKTALVRCVNTRPQKLLNYKGRKQNIRNTFKLGRSEIGYKRILIIDDIYTTGSTIDEIARMLKNAGAAEVYFLTLCIADGA